MAEFVERFIEQYTFPILEFISKSQLLTDEEIRQIHVRRRYLEYKIGKVRKSPHDYLEYIHHQCWMLALLKRRRFEKAYWVDHGRIEKEIVKQTTHLFKILTTRFASIIDLHLAHILFHKSLHRYDTVDKLWHYLLQLHPNKPQLWCLAADWHAYDKPAMKASIRSSKKLKRGKKMAVTEEGVPKSSKSTRIEISQEMTEDRQINDDVGIQIDQFDFVEDFGDSLVTPSKFFLDTNQNDSKTSSNSLLMPFMEDKSLNVVGEIVSTPLTLHELKLQLEDVWSEVEIARKCYSDGLRHNPDNMLLYENYFVMEMKFAQVFAKLIFNDKLKKECDFIRLPLEFSQLQSSLEKLLAFAHDVLKNICPLISEANNSDVQSQSSCITKQRVSFIRKLVQTFSILEQDTSFGDTLSVSGWRDFAQNLQVELCSVPNDNLATNCNILLSNEVDTDMNKFNEVLHQGGLVAARLVWRELKMSRKSNLPLNVFLTYVTLELEQTLKINALTHVELINQLRNDFELLILQFGESSVELWSAYIAFEELCCPMKAAQHDLRARKALKPALAKLFRETRDQVLLMRM